MHSGLLPCVVDGRYTNPIYYYHYYYFVPTVQDDFLFQASVARVAFPWRWSWLIWSLSLGQNRWSVGLAFFVPSLLSEDKRLFWRAFVPGAKQMICRPCFLCSIFAIWRQATLLKSFCPWGKTDDLSALLCLCLLCYLKTSDSSEELLSLGQNRWSVSLALFVPPLLSEDKRLFWRAFVPGAKQMICQPCFVCASFAIWRQATLLKSFCPWGKTDDLSALLCLCLLCYLKTSDSSEELLSLGQNRWSVSLALFVPPLLSAV